MTPRLLSWAFALALAQGPAPAASQSSGAPQQAERAALQASPLGGVAVDRPPAPVPQAAVLAVAPDPGAGHRALLRLGALLDDSALEEAVRSGLPLRVRCRVELWRDAFFDELRGSESWTAVLLYEPLEERYRLRTLTGGTQAASFPTLEGARAALEGVYPLSLRPTGNGRYYYTATMEVETLSLSDLEELERWLKGELRPAVGGKGSVPGAVGQGVKRLLIRVLGLPARRHVARSDWFRVP